MLFNICDKAYFWQNPYFLRYLKNRAFGYPVMFPGFSKLYFYLLNVLFFEQYPRFEMKINKIQEVSIDKRKLRANRIKNTRKKIKKN